MQRHAPFNLHGTLTQRWSNKDEKILDCNRPFLSVMSSDHGIKWRYTATRVSSNANLTSGQVDIFIEIFNEDDTPLINGTRTLSLDYQTHKLGGDIGFAVQDEVHSIVAFVSGVEKAKEIIGTPFELNLLEE